MTGTKIKVSDLRKFNQGSHGINYSVSGLTVEQFNDIYTELCDMYDVVNHTSYAHMSWFDGKMQGYINCKNNIAE